MPLRAPSMRVQLAVVGVVLVGLVAVSFAGGGDGGGGTPTPGTATPPTTSPRGFPPAGEATVCRTLITTAEAEALVGRALEEAVIEPQPGQCAWPVEEGSPLDAELFFEVLPRGDGDFTAEVAALFEGLRHRLEAAPGIGDDAYFAHRLADPDLGVEEDFVEGLYVATDGVVVVLASGGRDIWAGTDDEVRARLRTALSSVLTRLDERLG